MRCMKCGQELTAAICGHCGFDHRETPVRMLREIEESCVLFSVAAVTGIDEQEVDIITQYENGREYFQAEDYGNALQWLWTPAKRGSPSAQVLVGQIFELSEAHADQRQALYWYEQAGARGNVTAIRLLIRYYETAVPADEMEGVRFRQRLSQWRAKLEQSRSAGKSRGSELAANFRIRDGVLLEYTGTSENPVIPNGVTQIGDHAFLENTTIRQIRIPQGVTRIGSCAFMKCENLEQVTIPSTVTVIEGSAFSDTAITEIQLPQGLVTLGSGAFSGTRLRRVRVPGGVTKIQDQVFLNCNQLEEVFLEEGIEEIGAEAFAFCSELAVITIPDTVAVIDGGGSFSTGAFHRCVKLAVVHASAGWKRQHPQLLRRIIPDLDDAENFELSGTTLVKYRGRAPEPLIPEGIRVIGEKAFAWNQDIRRIRLPETVTTIGKMAFHSCRNLELAELPATVTEIEYGAFLSCTGLRQIRIPTGINRIAKAAFQGCKALTELEIPGNVVTVGQNAFALCHGLKTLILREGVQRLEDESFRACNQLETVTVPDTVREIGDSPYTTAFEICNRITTVRASRQWKEERADLLRKIMPFADDRLNFSMVRTTLMRYWGRAAEPMIPAGTTEINRRAFFYNTEIRRMVIPEGVRKIGDQAFWHCCAKEVILPESLREIGLYAFAHCGYMEKVRLPAGIDRIAGGAFSSSGLREIVIPGSVREVGPNAFDFCSQLKKVVIEPGVRKIEEFAFQHCWALEEVEMSDTVTTIAANAFDEASALRSFRASPQWKEKHQALMCNLPKEAR